VESIFVKGVERSWERRSAFLYDCSPLMPALHVPLEAAVAELFWHRHGEAPAHIRHAAALFIAPLARARSTSACSPTCESARAEFARDRHALDIKSRTGVELVMESLCEQQQRVLCLVTAHSHSHSQCIWAVSVSAVSDKHNPASAASAFMASCSPVKTSVALLCSLRCPAPYHIACVTLAELIDASNYSNNYCTHNVLLFVRI
jgi:hypothetical protein